MNQETTKSPEDGMIKEDDFEKLVGIVAGCDPAQWPSTYEVNGNHVAFLVTDPGAGNKCCICEKEWNDPNEMYTVVLRDNGEWYFAQEPACPKCISERLNR